MKEFKYVITDEVGLHARPAGLLVKQAGQFQSKVTISCNGKQADAKKLLMLMSLGVKQGMEVICHAEGEDEEDAIASLEQFLKENL